MASGRRSLRDRFGLAGRAGRPGQAARGQEESPGFPDKGRGRYDQALADLTRALELAPGDAQALSSRGQAYRLLGREEDAAADITRATGLNSGGQPSGGSPAGTPAGR